MKKINLRDIIFSRYCEFRTDVFTKDGDLILKFATFNLWEKQGWRLGDHFRRSMTYHVDSVKEASRCFKRDLNNGRLAIRESDFKNPNAPTGQQLTMANLIKKPGPNEEVEWINGDKDDMRWNNLRLVPKKR